MRKNIELKRCNSLENGIAFYSQTHKNHVLLSTINEQNKIKTEWITKEELDQVISKSIDKKIGITYTFLKKILCIITIQGAIISTILTFDVLYLIRFPILALLIDNIFLLFYSYKYHNKYHQSSFRFHSAEHMVANAYESLGRIPTIEEIYNFSRFTNRCYITTKTHFIILYFSFLVCSYIPNNYLMIIIMILIHFLLMFLNMNNYLNFFQKYYTKPPTDREVCVAIEGLKTWIEFEISSELES